MSHSMSAYWQDIDDVVHSSNPRVLTLPEALNIWADSRGVEGNFFGLIDENDRTVQFRLMKDIPDDIDDACSLKIVLVDFPIPALGGSYEAILSIGESLGFIERAYSVGADPERFSGLRFAKWS